MRIQIFFIESRGTCPCPCCQSPLEHRDYKLRIMKLEGGERRFLRVERRICTNGGCRKIHTALPDCLVPYKHYASEVIAGVLDEIITPEDAEAEDYPCEATMARWHHWLMANYFRIEGYLKSIGHCLMGLESGLLTSTVSLLETLRLSNGCWLETILRTIYNSGGFLEPA